MDTGGTRVAGARSFVLTHLDLYDWGAFTGRHSAEIDPRGTAIIGPTGSGKTTLIDALMTLITAAPRYNLASTGGHESDRDLVSYVRGVSGAGTLSGDNEHVARPGAVVTAIAARFAGATASLRIGALYWFDGSSSALADLKRRFFFCLSDAPDLDAWLEAHRAGGVRTLKQLEQDTPGLKIYETKQTYLARLRSYFEVGENAFNLLNRAAGLKQLNSIDEVFRELVLDDHSRFERAAEVADEFNTLASIRAELETARRQRDALLPVEREQGARLTLLRELDAQRALHRLIPPWYAGHGERLWGEQLRQLTEQRRELAALLTQLEGRSKDQSALTEMLHAAYLKVGGAAAAQLSERIHTQQQTVAERRRDAAQYQQLCRRLELDPALNAQLLEAHQDAVRQRLAALDADRERLQDAVYECGATRQRRREACEALRQQLRDVLARPGSNILPEFQRFRSALAQQLDVDESRLAYVAELVEVRPDEARWRGAIERAIGNERLRLLVEPDLAAAALDWINSRDHHLHVRMLEVQPTDAPPRFFDDGYLRKLQFKPHAQREACKHWLARFDRHCVETPEQLRAREHAMTPQGLMSSRRGAFDKQDQKPLTADWMTGFDNRDRVASLRAELETLEHGLREGEAQYETTQRALRQAQDLAALLGSLLALRFETIDLPAATALLEALQAQLQALSAPDSDADRARREWQASKALLSTLMEQQSSCRADIAGLEEQCRTASAAQTRAVQRRGEGLSNEQAYSVAQQLPTPTAAQREELPGLEQAALNKVQSAIATQEDRLKRVETQLVRAMAEAQRQDTGALSEVGTELRDIPHYLERLRVLTEEALPEKMQRFLAYLNQSSDQGVTQLLSDIENEVSSVEERIEDLNQTLRAVDFQAGRYLRLEPHPVVHESLRTLQQARRVLRAARLRDDDGESQYTALRDLVALLRDAVDRKKTLGARALLDPRYRLQFAVSVVDRATGSVIETRTSSQGGSGGEKEIIASYVLTASLSYALSPQQAGQPLFSTIVLDEAFSKSSQAVAGRIIRALDEFGLHPLFVTPNKELRLLRQHTHSAILIHRKGLRATMTSLSWEALEDFRQQRTRQRDEIPG